MCRFTAYMGQETTLDELLFRPSHSLVHQSYASREARTPENADGFGVGWYVPEFHDTPALYRNVRPAWADTNMARIAPVTRTNLFFAHVRAATPGLPINELNCHPFVRDRLMFMHNGSIGSTHAVIDALRDELPEEIYRSIEGSTDSEHAFAVIREALGQHAKDPSPWELGKAVADGIRRLERLKNEVGDPEDHTVANLALTDGRSLIAARYATPNGKDAASLYLGQAKGFTCNGDRCKAIGPGEKGSVILSSEKLWNGGTKWQEVPENHVLIVDRDLGVQTLAIQAA